MSPPISRKIINHYTNHYKIISFVIPAPRAIVYPKRWNACNCTSLHTYTHIILYVCVLFTYIYYYTFVLTGGCINKHRTRDCVTFVLRTCFFDQNINDVLVYVNHDAVFYSEITLTRLQREQFECIIIEYIVFNCEIYICLIIVLLCNLLL